MLYLIADDEKRVVNIDTKMFGHVVCVPAVFADEDHALLILYELEKAKLLPRPHNVHCVLDSFIAETR